MVAYISGGASVQTVDAPDVVSQGYGNMDGFSKCGSRTISISPSVPWLTVSGDTVTLQSSTPSDAHASTTFTMTVQLDSYPSIIATLNFDT